MDEAKRVLLGTIYSSERNLRDALQVIVDDVSDLELAWPSMTPLLRRHHQEALTELLTGVTDTLTKNSLMSKNITGITSFKDNDAVDQFFQNCEIPNHHDLKVLMKSVDEEEARLQWWFRWRRNRASHQNWVAGSRSLSTVRAFLEFDIQFFEANVREKMKALQIARQFAEAYGGNIEDDEELEEEYFESDEIYESDALGE
ncbi:uncharacterized protein PV09_01801 [Verruconis gallopava]|uniref:Uncharacterized protein n=1 Tax=Verruconis gallopava TaxID=253628 RepID=A0A0D2B9H1_9PEZI|nr:uncharacterized protein PV09_01801 [Verruconis gallopava]KIW07889.1 hypothetical protein PV09_01801 [Verruconis gallopava]